MADKLDKFPMSLIDLALSQKDKSWFDRLTSPQFQIEMEQADKDNEKRIKADSIIKHYEARGMIGLQFVTAEEAERAWKRGETVHVFRTKDNKMLSLYDIDLISDIARRDALRIMKENLCFLEGDEYGLQMG